MHNTVLSDFLYPLLFAHRGASSIAPENTFAAFKKAKECGCTGIELDIHLCKSGELVVIHDYSLKRTGRFRTAVSNELTVGPDILVEKLSLGELREYDFGIWFSEEFRGEKIPLLEEVLDFLGDQMYVDIEIKSPSVDCSEVSYALADFLYNRITAQNKMNNNVLVSSFNPLALRRFKQKYRDLMKESKCSIPTALIYSNDEEVPLYLRKGEGRFLCNPSVLKPSYKDLSLHKNLSGRGLLKKCPYFVWTVDDKTLASQLLSQGASALITNRPQDLLPIIEKFYKVR